MSISLLRSGFLCHLGHRKWRITDIKCQDKYWQRAGNHLAKSHWQSGESEIQNSQRREIKFGTAARQSLFFSERIWTNRWKRCVNGAAIFYNGNDPMCHEQPKTFNLNKAIVDDWIHTPLISRWPRTATLTCSVYNRQSLDFLFFCKEIYLQGQLSVQMYKYNVQKAFYKLHGNTCVKMSWENPLPHYFYSTFHRT